LLNKTKYKFPKRTALGIDNFRLEMIIAVLERYLKINF
jgi:predicted ATP-dependent serine protease